MSHDLYLGGRLWCLKWWCFVKGRVGPQCIRAFALLPLVARGWAPTCVLTCLPSRRGGHLGPRDQRGLVLAAVDAGAGMSPNVCRQALGMEHWTGS